MNQNQNLEPHSKAGNLPLERQAASRERLVTIGEVQNLTGFKSSYIYSKIQKGLFPGPLKIGNASRWRESDVQAWIDLQIREAQNER